MPRTAESGRVSSTRTNSILYNGNFEVRPAYTADTNTAARWIDGTAAGSAAKLAYGWGTPPAGSGVGANGAVAFDTSQFRSGTASMRLSNLNASGAVTIGTFHTLVGLELYILKPSTQYTLVGYIRTNNCATNSAFIDVREYDSAIATLATNSTNKLSGTDATWRQVTVTFTSNASTKFYTVFLRNNVTGNTSDAWFDDITLVPATSGRVSASGRVAP